MLYIHDELSVDRFNDKADRIVRLNTDIFSDGNLDARAGGSPAVAPTLIIGLMEGLFVGAWPAFFLFVALLTTLAQSRKAAVTNPVEVLRGE